MEAARRTAKIAFRAHRSMVTFKRLLAVSLPKESAQKKLWLDSETVEALPIPPLHLDI
jgi:hypothetical protein